MPLLVNQHLSGASPALPWCNTSPPPLLLASFWWNDLKAAIKHQRPYLSGTMQPGINHSGTTLVQKAPAPFWYNAASRHKAKSQLLLVGPWERPTQMKVMKMVMMSTTTMMEVVVNNIQKGLKYFPIVPKVKITFHTRDLSPYKKALHALHFCIFVPAPASPCVSLQMRLHC